MEPVRVRRWKLAQPDEALVDRISQGCSIDRKLAGLLVSRGIDNPVAAHSFLDVSLANLHDPLLFRDMDKATARLRNAIAAHERICVYGDYDVDGVTAVAVLVTFFRSVGADCFYHIPNRLEEGYGLSTAGILAASARGARVIVTADCGITACEEAAFCASLGIDLIITDHHTPPRDIPAALAVINPQQHGCHFPCKVLAGVGVAFNLVVALRSSLRGEGFFSNKPEPYLREYLDLVALGTIADIVPLTDENRILVSHGLRELSAGSRIGLRALKTVAGIAGEVDCGAVGFRLAPRLNAAGRLDDAASGVELLLTENSQLAVELAAALDESNAERQLLEQVILREAVERIQDDRAFRGRKSIVLASEHWHSGVIGIVASRIVDLFHRPTILISLQDGNGKGSARSIPGFHLFDALNACSDHLLRFGGHKYAAGLSIDENSLQDFTERFDEVSAGLLTEEDLQPELRIDAELQPEDLTLEFAERITTLEPFGMGNPRPVFALRRVKVRERTVLKERHIRLRLEAGGCLHDAIGFNMAGKVPGSEVLDVAFSLEMNTWKSRKSLQLRLKDTKESS